MAVVGVELQSAVLHHTKHVGQISRGYTISVRKLVRGAHDLPRMGGPITSFQLALSVYRVAVSGCKSCVSYPKSSRHARSRYILPSGTP